MGPHNSNNKTLGLLYLMEIFSGLARGAYLGCIGWTTLVISNDVAVVGQIFIVQSLTMMLAGPVVGVIIDRHNRRTLIILGQMFIGAAMGIIGVMLLQSDDVSVLWLFGAVIIITCARFTYRGAFDGIIRDCCADEDVMKTYARALTFHLLATSAGMAGIGFIIHKLSTGHAFVTTGAISIIIISVASFLGSGIAKTHATGLKGFWSDFKIGLEIFKNNKSIQILAMLTTTALPVGQLTNAILSSFIRDDLGMGSDVFGMVDAAWALGGMLGAAILSNKIEQFNSRYGEFYTAIMAGGATIALSYCTAFISLVAAHFFMGFFVWMCRIIIAGKVIENCDSENVGRTRTYVDVMFSISAMLMSFSPTLIRLEATASYFLYWGMFISASALVLLLWKKSQHPA